MRPSFRSVHRSALVLASLVAWSFACSALKTDPGQTDASVDASDTPSDDATAPLDAGSVETGAVVIADDDSARGAASSPHAAARTATSAATVASRG